MAAGLKKRYLRLVRRSFRLLRSPWMKRHPWLIKLIAPIFNRELWHPCRETVSSGLAAGLFMAMLPIPGQMLLAAVVAMKIRGNVAIAVASCWVTNPATQFFIMRQQELFGKFLIEEVGFPKVPLFSKLEGTPPKIIGIEFASMNAGSFITGFLISAILLSLCAFPLVYLLSALMPKLIPKSRYQRAKAKVIARQRKEEKQSKGRKKGPQSG